MAETGDRAADQKAEPVTLTEPEQGMPVAEPDIKPVSEPAPVAAEPPPAKGGGFGRFVGLTFGGVVAAGLGFGLATFGAREGWPLVTPPQAGVEAMQHMQQEITSLRAQLETATALAGRIEALEQRPAPVADLAPLENRLTKLESQGDGGAALAALQAQVADLAAKVAAQAGDAGRIAEEIQSQVQERLDAAEAETVQLRAAAERRAALLEVETALKSGSGLSAAVSRAEAAGVTSPAALTEFAASPVTLTSLQDTFAEAARAAISADAGTTAEAGLGERMASFLVSQTGARSLEPREGDDTDAVLSRAEAALRQGDVAAARGLVGQLPEAAQTAMAGWSAEADRWLAAQMAIADLLSAG
ncbi:hypothetical protein GCM10007291_45060 [Gemmobacter nanjingensis]|uniref:Inner membrane protein n=1 Tax=Gemmobacter nanjingensis TaxID=488454 RepID=A0ABQ3FSB7_9RHOB|nr:hypothetical protein [Gemmobacter nanjingensis]GHC38419.1 hypothetical protein GCM10007291_45060 [Gemmobacter nanjingensis]